MRMRKLWIAKGKLGAYEGENEREAVIVQPDLVSSHGSDGLHYPVLDIDHPCHVRPSETPGHFHLYIDKGVEWEKYEALLVALADAGIIERGYANASIERKGTFVAVRPWKGGAA